VLFDDPLDERETDPGPFVLVVGVEALEEDEDPVEVLGPDPVVAHREAHPVALGLGRDPDPRGHTLTTKLDGVRDQVGKDLPELGRVRASPGRGPLLHARDHGIEDLFQPLLAGLERGDEHLLLGRVHREPSEVLLRRGVLRPPPVELLALAVLDVVAREVAELVGREIDAPRASPAPSPGPPAAA
jgi:hypothetical protein